MKRTSSIFYCFIALIWFAISIWAVVDTSNSYRLGFIVASFSMGIEKLFDAFAPRRIWGE